MIIPPTEHTTINKIYQHYERTYNDGHRAHLGGSLIGRECERELWFTFRWATDVHHDGRLLKLFQRGHREELIFIDDLKQAGVEVYSGNPDGSQYTVQACGGHFGGSMDSVGRGFIEAPSRWHLIEMKTHNKKSFDQLVANGVRETKPEHFAQMQVYMYLAEPQLERALYLAVNKDTDELYSERFHLDRAFAAAMVDKAGRIIYAKTPPPGISSDPSFYKCKMCNQADTCHQRKGAAINCRTCVHSTPEDSGTWRCELHDIEIDKSHQLAGCTYHLYIPAFIDKHAKAVDASDSQIVYELEGIPDRIINGNGHYHSSEIKKAIDSGSFAVLSDPNLQTFCQYFGAKIEVLNNDTSNDDASVQLVNEGDSIPT